MTTSDLVTLFRDLVKEPNETVVSSTTIKRLLNMRYRMVCAAILNLNENYFAAIDNTIDFVDGQENYDLPDLDSNNYTRVMNILRIEMAYDGTNFRVAQPVMVEELPDTTVIGTAYSTGSPRYYLLDNDIYVLPTPTDNATNAIKMWYTQRQTDLSNDGDVPNFNPLYHDILAFGAAASFKASDGASVDDGNDLAFFNVFEQQYRDGLDQLLTTITPRDRSHPQQVTDITAYSQGYNPETDTPLPLTI